MSTPKTGAGLGDGLRELISTRRVLFFGGKGGVGKTTCAAACALDQAESGRRVLLVSTDPAHNLGHLFDRRVGPRPVTMRENLDALEIDPEQAAADHIAKVGDHLYGLVADGMRGEVTRYLRAAAAAPGAHEAALLERVAKLTESALREYDLVVFDTAPSGHTSRLLALPEAMAQWTDALLENRARADRLGQAARSLGSNPMTGNEGSPKARREREIRHVLYERRALLSGLRETLQDPQTTGFVIALAAERLPVLETIELRDQLRESKVDVLAYVINKRSPAGAGELLDARREMEEEWVSRLREAVGDTTIAQTPLLPAEPVGQEALGEFAELLLG